MAEDNDIFVGRLVEDQGGDGKEGVKPSSCLVHSLGDKVRRELLLKELLIFKRIMMLGKRHGAGIKPAVDHLRHTLHLSAALGTGDGHPIDKGAVQLDILRTVVRHGF